MTFSAIVFIFVVALFQQDRIAAAPPTGDFQLGFTAIAHPTSCRRHVDNSEHLRQYERLVDVFSCHLRNGPASKLLKRSHLGWNHCGHRVPRVLPGDLPQRRDLAINVCFRQCKRTLQDPLRRRNTWIGHWFRHLPRCCSQLRLCLANLKHKTPTGDLCRSMVNMARNEPDLWHTWFRCSRSGSGS